MTNGEIVFWASGCASCHVSPGAEETDRPLLAGGKAFKSDFGTFYAPNITPHPDAGIGGWSIEDFANAVQKGVSPDGKHYYPAFPFSAYGLMTPQDVVDLKAFVDSLPSSSASNVQHDVGFPFNIRRALGGWKFLFVQDDWVLTGAATAHIERGRYLVEAMGHCAECHTPRNELGGLMRDKWLTGAPIPGSATARIPSITPDDLGWSREDLSYYFETGFTPDFDSAGGEMAAVIRNLSRLSSEDRDAIAAYLLDIGV